MASHSMAITSNPLSLPPGEPGNEPFYNFPGNPFTAIGALEITPSFPIVGYSSVITPVPFNANAAAIIGDVLVSGTISATVTWNGSVAATGQITSTGSTSTGTASTGTASTGSTVSPTASKSRAGISRGSLRLAWSLLAVGIWIL